VENFAYCGAEDNGKEVYATERRVKIYLPPNKNKTLLKTNKGSLCLLQFLFLKRELYTVFSTKKCSDFIFHDVLI
jgi:hypothetical protein